MYKLLSVNGVSLPQPEGDYTLSKNDKYNEYEGEDGTTTVEVIRQGIISLAVSYNHVTEKHLKEIMDAIKLVSSVEVFDPTQQKVRKITAKITGIKTKMFYYKNGISVWTLAFNVDEL